MRMILFLAALTLVLSVSVAEAATVDLAVPGMNCELCPVTVRKALQKVPGVSAVRVELATKTAVVDYDPARATVGRLIKATGDAGYPSTVKKGG